ncbi:hypothetical protein CTAYLR_008306 [Chrysophaeum taylorii]|uniref:Peptidase C45 hydrolase domain-containing protein n=1 Tax=Chrysophaeum taylorii TaxID=2483200 RepID=A0AAD7XI08_9STRA|nr:hypothetical protein CTAYLR_008306 [Chrysophaeum taylorii]
METLLVPYVKFAGTAAEVGRQHGELLRGRVVATWRIYQRIFERLGATEEWLREFAATIREKILEFDETYVVEMDHIALAAGLEAWEILCLNARTEVLLAKAGIHAPAECTSIFSLGALGQNWDWDEGLERQIVVAEIERDGHRLVTVTEPGMLGKIGLSSAGVGTTLNALSLAPKKFGVPIHVLLRAALDAPSFDAAVDKLMAAPRGTSSHILLGSADGRSVRIEFAGNGVELIKPSASYEVHTNHYLGLVDDGGSPCSFARYARAMELANHLPSTTLEDALRGIWNVLLDEAGTWPICRPWRKTTSSSAGALATALGRVGTVCSVVMDLRGRRLWVTRGSPIDHPDDDPREVSLS